MIYESSHKLKQLGNQVFAIWTPANEQMTLKEEAKAMSRQATEPGTEETEQAPSAKDSPIPYKQYSNDDWKGQCESTCPKPKLE
jgi:hypothetical protein